MDNPNDFELPQTKPDSFMKVALFAALVACGMALYLFWQNQQLEYQLALSRQPSPSPSPNPSPTPSLPTSSEASPSGSMSSLAKVVKYFLPSSWSSENIPGSTISLGYDPAKYRTSIDGKFLTYHYQNNPGSFTFSLESYDGGSRHNFIYKQQGYVSPPLDERMEGYHEQEYLINGWKCLVLYRLGFSAAGTTWGMCPISNSQAIYFGGPGEENEIEQIFATLKEN